MFTAVQWVVRTLPRRPHLSNNYTLRYNCGQCATILHCRYMQSLFTNSKFNNYCLLRHFSQSYFRSAAYISTHQPQYGRSTALITWYSTSLLCEDYLIAGSDMEPSSTSNLPPGKHRNVVCASVLCTVFFANYLLPALSNGDNPIIVVNNRRCKISKPTLSCKSKRSHNFLFLLPFSLYRALVAISSSSNNLTNSESGAVRDFPLK